MDDNARHIPIRITRREPQAFAKGGLVKAAKKVAEAGRGGDDMIVHVNRAEFDTLRREWGEPTINPETGLPEFFLGGIQKWFKANPWASAVLPAVTSVLGVGNTLGGGINSLLGGALSPAVQNAVGSALLGGGVGALTGGGQGALTGALVGGLTPTAMDLLGGNSGGGLLGGLLGNSGGFNGGSGDLTRGLADRGSVVAAPSAQPAGGLLSGITGGSGALGGVTNLLTSKNAIPLAIGALALGSAFASKKPSAAQRAASANDLAANARFNRPLASAVPFSRTQTPMTAQDYYNYGLTGGRNQFADNRLPGYAGGGPIKRGLQSARELAEKMGKNPDNIADIREAQKFQKFHGGLMNDIGDRARAMADRVNQMREQGLFPMEVGTRFTTSKTREMGGLPWEVNGYYVDMRKPDRYGYRVQRGEPGTENFESSMHMIRDPGLEKHWGPERWQELQADVQPFTPLGVVKKADGGATGGPAVANLASAAQHPPSGYVRGPGGAREDKIPALLSDNEYVIDAETLALLGDGSPEHGAKKLDEMRVNIRRHKGGALSRGQISPDAKPAENYMRGRR